MRYERSFYDKYIKRCIDFILSLIAIVLLSPVLIIVSMLVALKLGRPVIFKQKRPGLNEKIFTMYKFRSMTDERDEKGDLLPDSIRLTSFGKKLRATSLDELPELLNILKGDMAIVGPRPQLVRDEMKRLRHCVRPGLTGMAQVNGRNNISWEDKFEYDLIYLKRIGFKLDINILIKTIKKVLKKEDITSEGMETAEDYGDYLLRIKSIDRKDYEKKQILAKELLKG